MRRNVHRAFVKLLANRAMRIKNRVDMEVSDLQGCFPRCRSLGVFLSHSTRSASLLSQQGGEKWGKTRILSRAFCGLRQAASYLKSVRVRTMAFVYKDNRDDLPVAISDEDAKRACKRCR